MIIPFTALSSDVLNAIIEEYVSREGTDYGEYAFSMEAKIEQVLGQLKRGQVVVVFDEGTESCDLVSVTSSRYRSIMSS